MCRWMGAYLLLVASGWAYAQPTTSTPSLPQVKTPDYFGPALTQTFNDKALFPNASSVIPGTSGSSAVNPTQSWNPFSVAPAPANGVHELPPTILPDESLPLPPPPKRWAGGFEFGLNGSQGNADVLSIRAGGQGDRKTPGNLFHFDLLYNLVRASGPSNQNQALLNIRDEILFRGTPWSFFSAIQVEYDQFRDYDLRAGVYEGFSYVWVKSDLTLFKTRVGAGAVRELDTAGPARDRWVPEAVLGMDYNHKFTDRQAFVSSADIYPNLSQLGQYRVRARAGYEILLDPKFGLVLRLGVQDRYDTLPGQSRRNDLNYFTTLLFRF